MSTNIFNFMDDQVVSVQKIAMTLRSTTNTVRIVTSYNKVVNILGMNVVTGTKRYSWYTITNAKLGRESGLLAC